VWCRGKCIYCIGVTVLYNTKRTKTYRENDAHATPSELANIKKINANGPTTWCQYMAWRLDMGLITFSRFQKITKIAHIQIIIFIANYIFFISILQYGRHRMVWIDSEPQHLDVLRPLRLPTGAGGVDSENTLKGFTSFTAFTSTSLFR